MKSVKFRELDIADLDTDAISLCKQFGLLFYRNKVFVLREPQAIAAKVFQ